MNHGKTIEMFLVDGTADGIVTAELSNWNGTAIKIPRTEVAACERQDIAGRTPRPRKKVDADDIST